MRGKLLGACPRGGHRTISHTTFGVIPLPQTRPALLMDRKSAPSAMPLACFQSSIATFTHRGMGTVRMCPALPSPARSSDDLPLPEFPRMVRTGCCARRSSKRAVSSSRPTKSQESSGSKTSRLRNGLCVAQYSALMERSPEAGCVPE
jgi:hypothetical protein